MFDPFDVRHQNKQKRRSSQQVKLEREALEKEMEEALRKAIAEFSDAEYITSSMLLVYATQYFFNYALIRRNLPKLMARLGYVNMRNRMSADGRWKLDGASTQIYKKEKSRDLGLAAVKKIFE